MSKLTVPKSILELSLYPNPVVFNVKLVLKFFTLLIGMPPSSPILILNMNNLFIVGSVMLFPGLGRFGEVHLPPEINPMFSAPSSLRFIASMASQSWKYGGYWFAKLELDSQIWLKISRPRLDVEGLGSPVAVFSGV